ncbi:DUF6560 family protein [Pseudobutyrivibrio xylanivorans]|uniref:Uncharacterized protein n=1 Tax=Pseudobutyrivibrio xylanivorans TaxID=185007 RepID=A0A1G5S0N8_PSEXY|nr:DUF6560 family protein [Pseudobutyrivibrio xylanivorans]SCZ79510.1 hypothetical protein SAMN02910350_01807 [Pseudobutyrivibrio xylanivorans]
MIIIKYIVIVTIVPFILDILRYKSEPKNYTKSLNKFTIRTGKSIIIIGIGWFVLTTSILLLCLYQYDEFPLTAIVLFGIFYFFALLSFLYATPRFWDIVVDGDDITVIKLFILKKQTKFSELSKVEIANNNYIKVFKSGRKRTFFLIDPMMKGKNNFLKRIEKENIPLFDKRKTDENNT